MINNCPHCRQPLRFSETQQAKINEALGKLTAGKRLTIKCPHCQAAIKLSGATVPPAPAREPVLQPPAPPDLDWLTTGRFAGEEKVEDVPMSLVLYPESPGREQVIKAMKEVGYQVVTADTADEAIKRMQFVRFSCVTLHIGMEGGLEKSVFHDYMRTMAMERRRYIFYILIGPHFHTLYNLEALSTSANLVVAEKDLKYFDVILRKAIPEYEELFGPILEELAAYGKR
ncbi:MAG: hypothetical protein DSY57_03525 [Desulfobulbus sp.]|nr:MAG: hypothetical protein DSY57_03525 [Desulfobulbus sp.]